MKRTRSVIIIGAGLALLVGTTSHAATTTGKVVATDPSARQITIETDDGRRLLFSRNDETRIERAGENIELGAIERDTRVTVTTDQTPTDSSTPTVATRVEVEAADDSASDVSARDRALEDRDDDTARVTSAGEAGTEPTRTARVDSADYDEQRMQRSDRLPDTATPLPLIALIGAGSLASGLALRLRRNRR
jgi:hypothetical protein